MLFVCCLMSRNLLWENEYFIRSVSDIAHLIIVILFFFYSWLLVSILLVLYDSSVRRCLTDLRLCDIVQLVDLLCNVAQAVIGYAISYNVFFGPCMSCDAFRRWSIRRRCTVSPDNLTGCHAHNFKKLNVSHTPSPGEKPFSRLSPNTLLYSLFQVSVLLYYIPPFHYI